MVEHRATPESSTLGLTPKLRRAPFEWRAPIYIVASLLAHAVFLLLVTSVPPDARTLSLDDIPLESRQLHHLVRPPVQPKFLGIANKRSRRVGGDRGRTLVQSAARSAGNLGLLAGRAESGDEGMGGLGRAGECPEPSDASPGHGSGPDSPFLDTESHPLSTFAADIDTASYSNVRRFLRDGQLPPAEAVRTEEMVNYFRYDYPAPRDKAPFTLYAEAARCPWNRQHVLVHLGLRAKTLGGPVPPRNLVFLIDVSGSMDEPLKLPLVKDAMTSLVGQLGARDRVAIVVYADEMRLALPSTRGDDHERIREAISRLDAGGSTNGGDGIQLAYRVARENLVRGGVNRVILATDGDFNVGVTDRSELVSMIKKERRHGVYLTVLGVGSHDLQDATLEGIADRGNGSYHYLDSVDEARRVLVEQAGSTLHVVAKDVKIQVALNPARVASYRLIGYENRLLASEEFHDDSKDAGELGEGHTVTVLYEIVPRRGPGDLLNFKLRYKEPHGNHSRLLAQPVRGAIGPFRAASTDFRFSAAVAAFSNLLRSGAPCDRARLTEISSMAEGALDHDPGGYRAEFLQLVAIAQRLLRDG